MIEFGGQVIGASITPEEDTLYVNVRKWPREVNALTGQIDELLPISEDVELLVVDLATMNVMEKVRFFCFFLVFLLSVFFDSIRSSSAIVDSHPRKVPSTSM